MALLGLHLPDLLSKRRACMSLKRGLRLDKTSERFFGIEESPSIQKVLKPEMFKFTFEFQIRSNRNLHSRDFY